MVAFHTKSQKKQLAAVGFPWTKFNSLKIKVSKYIKTKRHIDITFRRCYCDVPYDSWIVSLKVYIPPKYHGR